MGHTGDTGQAEQAELRRVALFIEPGELREMAAEYELEDIRASLRVSLFRSK